VLRINVISIRMLGNINIKNSVDEIIPIAIMFIYSAMKISAKVPELYSVLNPDTSSDSPSARSNGVRFVSARAEISHEKNNGQNIMANRIELFKIKELSETELINIIGVKIINAILTSYEIVWAILRSAPSNEYLLLDAHPANRVV